MAFQKHFNLKELDFFEFINKTKDQIIKKIKSIF